MRVNYMYTYFLVGLCFRAVLMSATWREYNRTFQLCLMQPWHFVYSSSGRVGRLVFWNVIELFNIESRDSIRSFNFLNYYYHYHHHHHHHHHHISAMELGHLLTRSGLTYPEVASKFCHDSFCQLENSVSLPWVTYYEALYVHVVSSFSCIPIICPELVLFLIPL